MKSLFQAAVAVALLFSSQSFAQNQEESTVKAKVEKPSKFGFSYAAEFVGNELKKSLADDPAQIVHYLEPKVKFTDSIFLSVVGRFNSTIGVEGKGAALSSDSYLKFGYPIYENEAGTSINGQLRYYIPTSKTSSNAWLVGIIQPRIYVSQSFESSGFGLDYALIPLIYHYNPNNEIDNKEWGHAHALEGNYKVSDFISAALGVESEAYFWEKTPMTSGYAFYPGVTMSFTEAAKLTFQWYQNPDLIALSTSSAYAFFSYKFL